MEVLWFFAVVAVLWVGGQLVDGLERLRFTWGGVLLVTFMGGMAVLLIAIIATGQPPQTAAPAHLAAPTMADTSHS